MDSRSWISRVTQQRFLQLVLQGAVSIVGGVVWAFLLLLIPLLISQLAGGEVIAEANGKKIDGIDVGIFVAITLLAVYAQSFFDKLIFLLETTYTHYKGNPSNIKLWTTVIELSVCFFGILFFSIWFFWRKNPSFTFGGHDYPAFEIVEHLRFWWAGLGLLPILGTFHAWHNSLFFGSLTSGRAV